MSVTIGFDGCQVSEDISPWSISWPSTGRNKTAKQKCPGSSESVGMVCCKLCTISAPDFMDNPEKNFHVSLALTGFIIYHTSIYDFMSTP